jgi:hypothetical protein
MSLLNSTFTHVLFELDLEDRDGFASTSPRRRISSLDLGSPFSSDSSSDGEDDDDDQFELPLYTHTHTHSHPLPGRRKRQRVSVTPKPAPRYQHRRFPSSSSVAEDPEEEDPFASFTDTSSFFRSQRRGSLSSPPCENDEGRRGRGRTRTQVPVGLRCRDLDQGDDEDMWIEHLSTERR